jgi:hypothetical protein
MPNYSVRWEICLTADNKVEAAREALRIHRDPESTAVIFEVRDDGIPMDEWTLIDLEDEK